VSDVETPLAGTPGPPSSRREAATGPASSRRGHEGHHACVFELEGERFAIDTAFAVEAVSLGRVAAVPLAPPWLLGITSLRGTPLPVADLKEVLGLPRREGAATGAGATAALVLRVEGILLAIRVDRVEAVYSLEGTHFVPVTAESEGAAVKGLLDAGRGGPAALLDGNELARRVSELRLRPRWEPA